MPSKNDINPETGQAYAVNPSTGVLMCLTCKKGFMPKKLYRLKIAKYCSRPCYWKGRVGITMSNKGRPLTLEHRAKLSGPNANNWQGGITKENELMRKRTDFRKWRKTVFERDNFTCQTCRKRGGTLNADHIKPFSLYPKLRYIVSNGRTLCELCHKETDTWGGRVFKYAE